MLSSRLSLHDVLFLYNINFYSFIFKLIKKLNKLEFKVNLVKILIGILEKLKLRILILLN